MTSGLLRGGLPVLTWAVVGIAHAGVAGWLLAQVSSPVSEPVAEAVQVRWIAPEPPVLAPEKPTPAPRRPAAAKPVTPPPQVLAVAAEPTPTAPAVAAPAVAEATPAPDKADTKPAAPVAVAVAAVPPRFDADYLNNPPPDYPRLSRDLREQGLVLLRVRVASDGRPVEIAVENSSRHPRLDQAAERAVATWRFVPARLGREPVEAWVRVPINFNLRG